MTGFLMDTGNAVIVNIIQIAIGCLLAVLLCHCLKNRTNGENSKFAYSMLIIALMALSGMILPLGTFGIIPIIATLFLAEIKVYYIVPMFISNALFNLSIPFTEFTFSWNAGVERITTAFAAGFLAGVILKISDLNGSVLFRTEAVHKFAVKTGDAGVLPTIREVLDRNIKAAAGFLIIGCMVNAAVFRAGTIDMSGAVQIIYKLLSGHNLMNPLIILATIIAGIFLDLARLAAMLTIFRLRAIAGYYIYYSLAAGFLVSISLFIY